MFAVGQRIGERYRLESVLGSGSGGTVFRALDELTGAPVALKTTAVPRPSEFAVLAGVDYPGLAAVFDLGFESGRFYFTQALAHGTDLRTFAHDRPAEALGAFADLAVALHGLHSLGVRHNDVKPENVLVHEGRATLVDLGLAGPLATDRTDLVAGTPGFMAPEIANGEPADGRADWYSFGATLTAAAQGLPARVGALVERLVRRDPSERPRDAAEILAVLAPDRVLPSIPLATELFGREAELALVERLLESLDAEGARVLLVESDRGVGASRLLCEWKWIAQTRGRVVEGRAARSDAVRDLLARATRGAVVVRNARDAIAARAHLVSSRAPVVLVLDDVDRLEPGEGSLLAGFLRLLEPTDPIAVLAAAHGPWPSTELGSLVTRVRLAPFDAASTHAWLRGRVPARDIPRIFDRTRGIAADVRALVDRGAIDLDRSDEARFASLPASDRRALALVALAGPLPERAEHAALASWLVREPAGVDLRRSSDRERIRRMLGAASGDRALASEAAALLREQGRGPALIELLVEIGSIDEAEAYARARRDAIVADRSAFVPALAALGVATHDAALAVDLASILEDAGEPSHALRVLAAARRRGASSQAIYLRASSAALRLSNARMCLRHARRARARAEDERARAEIGELEARALVLLGDARGADEIASRALDTAALPAALVAALEEARALAKSYLGDVQGAKLGLERAELASERSSPRVRARIASYRGMLAFRTGDFEAAGAAYRKAQAIARDADLVDHHASAALNRGTVSHRLGDFGDARASYEEALALARMIGKTRTEIAARYDLAQLRCDLGLFDRARREASELEARARAAGIELFVALAKMVRGEAALHAGDLGEAEDDFAACRAALEAAGARRELADLEVLSGELHLRAGRFDRASSSLERARAILLETHAGDLEAREVVVRARLALATDPKVAVSLLGRSARRARESGERDLEAEIENVLAEACAAQRAHDAAAGHAQKARELLDECAATVEVSLRDAFFAHPRRRSRIRPEAVEHRSGERERLLERLLSINARLNATHDVRAILDLAMDAAIEITEAERGFVILASESGELDVAASRNLDRERIDRDYLKFSRTIAERVIASGEPMITTDAHSDSRFAEQRSIQAMRLRSVIGVPIRGRDRVLGALYLDNRFAPGRFAESQVRELLGFADQVAIALVNARLVADLEERTRELEAERARIRSSLENKTEEVDRLHREIAVARRALGDRGRGGMLGRSAAMRALFESLERVAASRLTVLVTGESGTGKELVARAIHGETSSPFVGINCAALPEALLESELFGHARGAFTGADRDREGLLSLAADGTLFLDEIGELPLGMQAKLLRAIQEREIRPVGSAKSISIAARIVCATNRDLRAEVSAGRFREDLYFRIAVVELRVPPLRDRVDDLPELAANALDKAARDSNRSPKRLHPDALRVLARHPWPGNVRELENALARAQVMARGDEIGVEDLVLGSAGTAPASFAEFERKEAAELATLLESTRWNVAEVARRLGISRTTLYRKLEKHALDRRR